VSTPDTGTGTGTGSPGAVAPLPEPRRRLAPSARRLWRTSAALAVAPVVIAAIVAPRVLAAGALVSGAALTGALALAVVAVVVVPELLWRRWRYEIGLNEIDIRHGSLAIKRTLVPISRIQHVETRRGPLQRAFGLATVIFHTAAGGSEIPQLTSAEATAVGDRVAALTRAPDDV